MSQEDKAIRNLLELDGVRFVIDESLGLWVKFDVKRVEISNHRPDGIKYSFSLHDRFNKRIMGFDNAHAIEYGKKMNVASKKTYYHWHRNEQDVGQPYDYVNAGKLLEDFWAQVEIIVKRIEDK